MNANIFDTITEKNSSKKKDGEKTKDKEKSHKHQKSDGGSKYKTVEAVKDASSSSTSSNSPTAGLDKLSENMQKGFEMMKEAFENFGKNVTETIRDELQSAYEYDELEEQPGEEELAETAEENIFNEISEGVSGEITGPELNPPLAQLVNKLVSSKMTEERAKEKEQQYRVPKNVQFATAPRINKPIWESMKPYTRSLDGKMQSIHKNVLKSALPVAKVMEELYENRETPDKIDINAMITTLADSLNFVGSANVGLVKARKALIKNDLPNNMQGLCQETDEISASYLFGDNLNARIKEVTELNKVKRTVFSDNRGKRGSIRGRFRGRFRGFSRGNYGRTQRRYHPYQQTAYAPAKKARAGSQAKLKGP